MIRKGWPPEKQIRSFLQEIPKIQETEQNVEPSLNITLKMILMTMTMTTTTTTTMMMMMMMMMMMIINGDFGEENSRNRGFNCYLFMKQYLITFTFLSFITLFTDALKTVLSLYTFSMDGARAVSYTHLTLPTSDLV